jgi:acyl carrier protein
LLAALWARANGASKNNTNPQAGKHQHQFLEAAAPMPAKLQKLAPPVNAGPVWSGRAKMRFATASRTELKGCGMSTPAPGSFTSASEQELRNTLKRCSPETVEAAVAFRKTGDTSQLNTIVLGLVERFMEPELRPKLHQPDADDMKILEDLGVDSLTMVELVMLVEETLALTVDNNELRGIKTVGDIKRFVAAKVQSKNSAPA